MLQRVALSFLMMIVLGVAAIVAAGHFGIPLPWHRTAVDRPPSSSDRDQVKAPASKDAAQTAEKAIDETTTALGGGTDTAAPATGNVAIDISRISPDGTSVFAGRAEPDSYVTVMEDGKPTGTVKSDENGEWSLSTDHKFASVDPKLTYEVSRTPPPAAAPPEPKKVAKADTAPQPSSNAAGEVMRKFENLVEEARKEAKKNEETKKPDAPAETAPSPGETVTAVKPDVAEPEVAETDAAEPDVAETDVEPSTQANATSQSATSSETGTAASSKTGATASATVTLVPPSKSSETAGVKTDVIPVPIMFVYNEAKLTPEGERAAALLLEYLNLKHFSVVELTGHADERGTDAYNYDLSRERLDTVSQLLKDGGFRGDLTLTPKGKSEPYMGVDRSAYSGETLYQLDRRVELRVTR